MEEHGELRRRREKRASDEIEAIALASLRSRFEGRRGEHGLADLAAAVVEGKTDPYAAADELVDHLSPAAP